LAKHGKPRDEIAAGYLHLYFPGRSASFASGFVHDVLHKRWTPLDSNQTLVDPGYASWRHRSADVRLSAVVIGYLPFAITIGREDDGRGGHLLVRRTLRTLYRKATKVGGPILDEGLARYHWDAERRHQQWQTASGDLAWHEFLLGARQCRHCNEYCSRHAQECPTCEHPFTLEDDASRDLLHGRVRQQASQLRATLARLEAAAVAGR
jgi:hypothetical protein